MTQPLDRFRHLEGARPAEEAGEDPTHTKLSRRFAAVASHEAAPGEPAPAPAAAERAHDPFAPPPVAATPTYELEPRDARPTLRCAECGFENARNEHDHCFRCHAPLDSRAARHLNMQLEQDEREAQAAAKKARVEAALAAPAAEPVDVERPGAMQSALPAFDRLALRMTAGSFAKYSLRVRRAIVVAGFASALGLGYLATGSALMGFLLGLAIALGACVVLA